MKLAVNYSDPTADLLCAGAIQIDTFKCPAWPDVVATAQELHPTYVHFPLNAGAGIGDAIDGETKQHADWRSVEALRDLTDTPYVNLHLAFGATDYPTLQPGLGILWMGGETDSRSVLGGTVGDNV